ncbi:MAG: hypothetical protein H0X40_18625 [Chthoniobacterales bacterium]|nr:hypothetical protein [Chthoniobacterales bacterium]
MTLRPGILASLLSTALSLHLLAGTDKEVAAETAPVTDPGFRFSGEITIEQSYVGESDVAREGRDVNFDELYSNLKFVYTPRIEYGIIRAGAQFERYSLGFSGSGAQVPNTLQALNAVVGFDTKFSDSILVRLEAQPGFYGTTFDQLDGDQFNVPFILGGTYIYSPELQFVLGVGVNFQQKYPVLPGGGLRWKFAPHWILNAILPTPHLEYELGHAITLFAGADIKTNTFRVDDRFGARNGDTRLNNAWLNYEEVRVSVGADWKINSSLTFRAEGGYVPYHDLDYDRADIRYHNVSGAPYGSIMLQGNF